MRTVKTKAGTELPLLDMKGKSYLSAAYRLVWFREERPLWSIETEFVVLLDKSAIAKATIRNENGKIMATAHKSETVQGFPDFMEKAETGSIARALAMCGYGTQFTDDLDEAGRFADSPLVSRQQAARIITGSQPDVSDGVLPDESTEDGYRVTFGKFAKRGLDEIHIGELADYVVYLENQASKKGKAIEGQVLEFITRASNHIAKFEREAANAMKG